ncbi:MAG: hypothetical protein KatS3mg027_1979 [Bacteroidia bacterium]|nr:MAG: hypothetical protein KatS3mg027_1979 [Bacteroidia bacterium]
MKFFFGTLVSLIICTISIAQNNLIIFSEKYRTIPSRVEGVILFPAIPQTDVKLTQINDNPIKVKIIFANP